MHREKCGWLALLVGHFQTLQFDCFNLVVLDLFWYFNSMCNFSLLFNLLKLVKLLFKFFIHFRLRPICFSYSIDYWIIFLFVSLYFIKVWLSLFNDGFGSVVHLVFEFLKSFVIFNSIFNIAINVITDFRN